MNDEQSITKLAISLIVAVIVVGCVLIPVINDTTKTTDTFQNSGNGLYSYISAEDTYTLTWSYDNPTKVTVNGEELSAVSGNEALAMGDFCVRMQPSATGYVQYISPDGNVTSNASDSATFSMTYEDGTLTVVGKSGTVTAETDGFYALNPTGDYTMKATTTTAYMNANTPLLVMGITVVGSQWNTGFMVSGTVTDYEASQWNGTTQFTISDETSDIAKVDGYKDLYTLKQFQFKVDNNGTPQTVTYNYFLVPTTVSGELDQHLTAGEIAIMDAIPFLIIAALVVMAAGAIYFKREY